MSPAKALRQRFYKALWSSLGVVWPIFSLLLGLGVVTAMLEGWRWFDGVYFAFITGLTVGYGDLVPSKIFRAYWL